MRQDHRHDPRQRTGRAPVGWRSCTQSPNSLELLMEHGYLFNSNSFSHDLPFLWEANGKVLVELPRQPFGDGRTYQHRGNDAGNPHDTLLVWKSMFDEFHEESKLFAGLLPVPVPSLHLGPARPRQDLAQHHPAHEKGRGRVVRDRQRARALVPRRGVQARARDRGVLIPCVARPCGRLPHDRRPRAGGSRRRAGLAGEAGAHRVAVRGRRQLRHDGAYHGAKISASGCISNSTSRTAAAPAA